MATGLATFHQTKVQIYPNPSEGRFTLNSIGIPIKFVSVQNSLGELILSQKIDIELFELDLTSKNKGLYFVIIETDEGIVVGKAIVY